MGLIIIGPRRLPVVVKTVLKFYKRIQSKFSILKKDIEEEVGAEELNKDVFNELRMEELENIKDSKDV